MKRKIIVLDRDGVVNEDSDLFIKSVEEWVPIYSSILAIKLLNNAGYEIAIATNQSGIKRGLLSEETLNSIHNKMLRTVEEHGARFIASNTVLMDLMTVATVANHLLECWRVLKKN